MSHSRTSPALIEKIEVSCYTVPTETPESDGTLKWDKTTVVLVEATAGGKAGHWLFLRRRLHRQADRISFG